MARTKGALNKTTTVVKEAIERAYHAIGSDTSFFDWARENPNIFYGQLLPKLLPVQLNHAGHEGQPLQPFAVNVAIPGIEPEPAPEAGQGLPN